MKTVLPIIDGVPLLTELDETELSDEGYKAVVAINEVVRTEDNGISTTFATVGEYAHNVLEYSVKSLMANDSPEAVKQVVEVFGLKCFFADAFSDMIDNLGNDVAECA